MCTQIPTAFLVHDVVEVALITNLARGIALRYANGSVLVVEESNIALGLYRSTWLGGRYAALTSGSNSLCFLNVTGYAHCRRGVLDTMGNVDVTPLFAQDIQYKQISCGSNFACGLRANDSRVECAGRIGIDQPLVFNSSALTYTSIAAQWEA